MKDRLAVLRMHIGIRDSSMNGKAGVGLAAESRPADSGLPALAVKREENPVTQIPRQRQGTSRAAIYRTTGYFELTDVDAFP
jgi:hypothetical protein